MIVLACKLTFFLPYSSSLKDKRRLRRQWTDRMKKRVLLKEVATQESHQILTLGFALVSLREADVQQQLRDLTDDMLTSGELELHSSDWDLIKL